MTGEYSIDATWIGGVFAALWVALLGLVGVLYNRDQAKFKALFHWRDEFVEKTVPTFVRQDRCDQNHQALEKTLERIIRPIADEQLHQRRLLEHHLKMNGGLPPEDGP